MRKLSFVAVIAASCGVTSVAYAHAHLHSAIPAVNSAVTASPPNVAITYTEGVEPRFSAIEVQDAAGKRVDKQNVHAGPGDDKILVVGLPPLQPGVYTVKWHVTATDTHKTEGAFKFTVKP